MTSPATILRAARKLIESPERWTKGRYSMHGEAPFCAVGAIGRAAHFELRWGAIEAMVKVIGGVGLCATATGAIQVWNDDPATTHADVLAAFDRAIALAEREDEGS